VHAHAQSTLPTPAAVVSVGLSSQLAAAFAHAGFVAAVAKFKAERLFLFVSYEKLY
jgi:hypothetical protein